MLWSRVLLLRNTYLIWCYQLGRNPWKSKNIVSKGPPLGSVWKSKTFPHWSQGGTLGNDVGKKLFLNSNLSTIIMKSEMEWWKVSIPEFGIETGYRKGKLLRKPVLCPVAEGPHFPLTNLSLHIGDLLPRWQCDTLQGGSDVRADVVADNS